MEDCAVENKREKLKCNKMEINKDQMVKLIHYLP